VTSLHDVSPVIVISTVLGILLLAALVVGVARAVTSGFFGDEPGGRDPNLRGQFMLWGTGPKYIEFLQWKRNLIRKARKKY
jgi:hypothetical protein